MSDEMKTGTIEELRACRKKLRSECFGHFLIRQKFDPCCYTVYPNPDDPSTTVVEPMPFYPAMVKNPAEKDAATEHLKGTLAQMKAIAFFVVYEAWVLKADNPDDMEVLKAEFVRGSEAIRDQADKQEALMVISEIRLEDGTIERHMWHQTVVRKGDRMFTDGMAIETQQIDGRHSCFLS